MSNSTSTLADFEVVVATAWGETVFLCGNAPALGSWDLNNAIALVCGERRPKGFVWKTEQGVNLPKGQTIEYKYLKVPSKTLPTRIWEQFLGNRTFLVQSADHVLIQDDLFDHPVPPYFTPLDRIRF